MRRAALLVAAVSVAALPAARSRGPSAAHKPFHAHVRVEWVDRAGTHQAELDMESSADLTRVVGPGQEMLTTPGARMVRDHGAWSLMWFGPVPGAAPVALSGKYELVAAPGQAVDDRSVSDVLVRRAGEMVERLSLDVETGLMLRREVFDGGRRVRLVQLEGLRLGDRAGPKAQALAFNGGFPRDTSTELSPQRVPAPFSAPARLAGDYRRIGVYRRGHTVHLLYGDGLHAISVFAEAGQLAEGDLPAGADRVRVGNTSGSHYAWPGGDVLTWEAGGLVYTAVGDAPERDLLAAAASLPGARALPALDRLRRRCRAVVETLFGR